MKKIILGAVLLSLAFASLGGTQDKPVIAVVDFRSLGLDEFVGQTIAEIIRTELIGTGKFKVLERGALQKVLEEQQLSMSGVADEQTAVKVGKLVGAKFVVVGSISKLGVNYILNSRLVDVESGEAVQGKSFQGKNENELPSMARQLVLSVADVGEKPTEEARKDVVPSVAEEPKRVAGAEEKPAEETKKDVTPSSAAPTGPSGVRTSVKPTGPDGDITWATKTPMPTKRRYFAVGVVNSKIYVHSRKVKLELSKM